MYQLFLPVFLCPPDSGRVHEQACILMLKLPGEELLYAPVKCTSWNCFPMCQILREIPKPNN